VVADNEIGSFRDLVVWQKSLALSVACYNLTKGFPREELYGMVTQIRRSSVSVAANIAGGHGREQNGSFIQFLRIAQGSLKELETHLLIVEQVGLSSQEQVGPHCERADEIGRMLRSLIRVLEQKTGQRD
jgi:four helix bundle protein